MTNDLKSNKYFIFKIIASSVILLLAVYFFLPFFMGGLNEGTAFAHAGCAWVLFLIWIAPKLMKKGGFIKVMLTSLITLTAILAMWFVFLSFKILSSATALNLPENTTVMVLGARVTDDGVSPTLKNRLDIAYEYLKVNPDANVVVTGGQGSDEPRPEADVQKDYLMDLGIEEDRIIVENKSTSTRENMAYSLPLIDEKGLDNQIIVATQDFHMYRAIELARDNGYIAYALPAKTEMLIFPAHYSRELLALTKYYGEKILLGK